MGVKTCKHWEKPSMMEVILTIVLASHNSIRELKQKDYNDTE